MKAYESTNEWLARQQERIARHLQARQDHRQAPDEVIRRTVNGERVVTRRHGNGR
jgi:hypothetical protein